MQSLLKAVTRSGSAGEPLPTVYKTFEKSKINFRRGATSMFAGWPGSYKTAIALNLMLAWARAGLLGFYISADDDAIGVAGRVVANITGYPIEVVEDGLRNGSDFYTQTLNELRNLRFIFSATDIDEIDRQMRFYLEMWGRFPDFVFIDNLMNVVDSTDDFGHMRDMTKNLALMSRDARTHFCILHHTSEAVGQVGVPPPRFAIQGKVSQFPQLILTVGAQGTTLNVCPGKNRHGPQDPTGTNIVIPFQVFPDTMRVKELWEGTQLTIGA